MDHFEVRVLTVLAMLDFVFTAWGIKHGYRELNPLINAFGVWFYLVLYAVALVSAFVLDKVAECLGVDFQPSRLFILVYIITVGNNAVVTS